VPGGHPGPRYVLPPPPPPLSPAGQPLASFLDRFLAHLVDTAVLTAVMLVFTIPAMIIFTAVIMPDLVGVQPDGAVAAPRFLDIFLPLLIMEAALIAVALVASYVYYVEMMFRTGQTLGKKTMKIRVVPLAPTATLGRGSAAKRFLVQYVAGMFLPGLTYVDGLWQLWDRPFQQCLHDKFADTVVVKVPA
jgi:uncharacterized RDD family membrane protein YckC